MRDPRPSPTSTVFSTAARLGTGSAPGWAVHTGQVRVLGSPPYSLGQRQNILVAVFSCTWISRPITASQPSGTLRLRSTAAGALTATPPAPAAPGRRRRRAPARGPRPADGSRRTARRAAAAPPAGRRRGRTAPTGRAGRRGCRGG